MKNIFKYIIFAAAAIITASCARTISEGVNEANQRYFDAWLKVNASKFPKCEKTGRGIYVIDETKTDGSATVVKDGYAIVEFTTTDLTGNITDYTNAEQAEQLGVYSPSSYYGPQVWSTTDETIRAGVLDGILGMKTGDTRKFIVPSWLMSYDNFSTEQEYLSKSTDFANTIFDVKVTDFTMDINEWQFVQMTRKFNEEDFYGGRFAGTTLEDTTGVAYGMFFKPLVEELAEEEFKEDTTIYINYIGKLLNGLIFDTNIERVALDNNISTSGRTFGPTSVNWGEEYDDITLDDSEVIPGFSKTLWKMGKMRKGSKAIGMFYSGLGYGYSGSTNIPGYAPLIFEIEFVEKPEIQ
jgi:FKBP-type peptidyl-prolyl cis-trans isomerase